LLAGYVDVGAVANAGLVALATSYLAIAAAFQLVDAAQVILAGALRGCRTRVPMAIAMLGYWLIGFAIAFWLGLHTPLRGWVWIGLALGLAAVSVLLGWRWARRERLGLMTAHEA
jgi:MATE family multidrug resistance protein